MNAITKDTALVVSLVCAAAVFLADRWMSDSKWSREFSANRAHAIRLSLGVVILCAGAVCVGIALNWSSFH